MSEYHKIETLYERDEQTHRLKRSTITMLGDPGV